MVIFRVSCSPAELEFKDDASGGAPSTCSLRTQSPQRT